MRIKIPNTLSTFWSGRMSWLRYYTLLSFRVFHPDWDIYLCTSWKNLPKGRWKSHNVDDREYLGPDWRSRLGDIGIICEEPPFEIAHLPPAYACDLYEWHVLGTRGGWYCDMDVVWLKSIHNAREADHVSLAEADAAVCMESGYAAVGLFGATPNCLLFRQLYDHALHATDPDSESYQKFGAEVMYRYAGTSHIHDPSVASRTVGRMRRMVSPLKIAQLCDETVYPFDWRQVDDIFRANATIPAGACGIHWFGGHPTANEFAASFSPDGLRGASTSTITKAIRRTEIHRAMYGPGLNLRNPL